MQLFSYTSIYFGSISSAPIIALIPIISMVAATLAVHELIDLNKNGNSDVSH